MEKCLGNRESLGNPEDLGSNLSQIRYFLTDFPVSGYAGIKMDVKKIALNDTKSSKEATFVFTRN